ncbi:MAG: PQQ-binding-like beta-propeller repeat protein [Planctomycetota bacterium]
MSVATNRHRVPARVVDVVILMVVVLAGLGCDRPSGVSWVQADGPNAAVTAAAMTKHQAANQMLVREQTDTRTRPDWPRFLNKSYDGVAGIQRPQWQPSVDVDWQQTPVCLWSMALGEGYGLGVVRDGRYYHFDAHEGTERLRCLDAGTGQEIWSQADRLLYRDMYGYEPGPRCSPTLAGDRIVTFGVAGRLSVRSVVDGTPQWSVDTNADFGVVQNFFGVGSSPLVIGNTVIVMVGGSPAEDQDIAPGRLDRVASNGTLLVGFDLNSGERLWATGDDLASYSSPRPMVIDGRVCVLMFARDQLHVIDAESGQHLGQVYHRAEILESVNAMVPVVDGNRVLVSDCYERGSVVFELSLREDAIQFDEVWRDPEGRRREQSLRSHLSTPVLIDGFLYACSGRNAPDSDFRCLELATGKVRWTDLSRRRSTATRLGDVLLVLKETGTLHIVAADPKEYRELAQWDLSQSSQDRPALRFPCWSAPVVAGDQIYVRGDRNLVVLALP